MKHIFEIFHHRTVDIFGIILYTFFILYGVFLLTLIILSIFRVIECSPTCRIAVFLVLIIDVVYLYSTGSDKRFYK